MIEKILNRVKQMGDTEKSSLLEHIESHYFLKEKSGMLRDDIKDKVLSLIQRDFVWMNHAEIYEKHELEKDLRLDGVDITLFTDTLLEEFEIDSIDFAKAMAWETVKDIVDYLEDTLEEK